LKVAVYGLGYVGLTAAVCLVEQGHTVVGIDVSVSKVAAINGGISPIVEPGVPEMLAAAIGRGHLRATTALGRELNDCHVAIVCVGTPSAPDGSHDMSYIEAVSREIASSLALDAPGQLSVVYRSTMRPGTMETFVAPIFRECLGPFEGRVELIYNPEFLRESVAVNDYFNPPKIVIGTADGRSSDQMDQLHHGLSCRTFYTSYKEAEITKFVDNTFHALKVAFGNEIGRICSQLDIDVDVVHEIFVSDVKLNISPNYFRPGGAFGGSCLPKDVRALSHIAGTVAVDVAVIGSLMTSNEAHKQFVFERMTRGVPRGAWILVNGLSFKAATDDIRESPNVDLVKRLLKGGYNVRVFDPAIRRAYLVGQNQRYIYGEIPEFDEILVDEATALGMTFDLVLEMQGRGTLPFSSSARVVRLEDIFGPPSAEG
jgi:GDP-mannose 6-dehydrogenase